MCFIEVLGGRTFVDKYGLLCASKPKETCRSAPELQLFASSQIRRIIGPTPGGGVQVNGLLSALPPSGRHVWPGFNDGAEHSGKAVGGGEGGKLKRALRRNISAEIPRTASVAQPLNHGESGCDKVKSIKHRKVAKPQINWHEINQCEINH